MTEPADVAEFRVVETARLEKSRDGRVYEVVEIDADGQVTTRSVDYSLEDD